MSRVSTKTVRPGDADVTAPGSPCFAGCAALILALVSACSDPPAAVDAGADNGPACLGPTPYCTLLHAECCEDTGFASRCVEGAWVCDPCALGPAFCERGSVPTSECSRWARDAWRHDMSVAEYCEGERN